MKYLLCRPAGGLNDTLVQIYHCYEYCKKHNRCLLVDTAHSSFFLNSFHKYFTFINEDNIIYDTEIIKNLILNNKFSVYPNMLTDILYSYKSSYVIDSIRYNNISLRLDFTKEYDADIILHNDCGAGHGAKTLSLLRINNWLIDIINYRYNLIKKPYTSIHIRNTDHKTDYMQFCKNNHDVIINDNIFLATDSKNTLDYFKSIKKDNLYTFITSLDNNNYPLHYNDYNDKEEVIIDTISDLLLLALSTKCVFPTIKMGYATLAYSLFNNKELVNRLITPSI
jgi:hypothetical protein